MVYEPPKQSLSGQIVDVIILLILTLGVLYAPIYFELAGPTKAPAPLVNPSWEKLGQNAGEQRQWAALGITDPAAANDIITSRYNYSFSWIEAAIMAMLVIGYFGLVVQLSDQEYREVIDERFGPAPKDPTGDGAAK